MTNYARGADRERQEMRHWEDLGYVVARSAGSHGAADLIALKDGERPQMIQVKGTARGPFATFGPRERGHLLLEADKAGADALLVWRPPGSSRREVFGPDRWP